MSSRRTAKLAEAIREIVSTTVLFELRDPRVKNVTVLHAEVGGDLRTAKIYVSVMGDEKTQALTMHGLKAARGFIQSKIAERLDTRYTPILTFVLDPGVKRSIQAAAILREALGGPATVAETESAESTSAEAESVEAESEKTESESDTPAAHETEPEEVATEGPAADALEPYGVGDKTFNDSEGA
jgi:ribosome-binding factor A